MDGADPKSSELELSSSKEAAVKAVMDALPQDAVIRGEDDGIGRFAGERTLVIVGGDSRLQLFQGSWGALKGRLDRPQLEVVFDDADGGARARLSHGAEAPPTAMARGWDFVSQGITVAAVVVAYHYFRSIPVDYGRTAMIAVGGAVAWSAIAHFWPKAEQSGLEGLVRGALAPLAEDASGSAEGD